MGAFHSCTKHTVAKEQLDLDLDNVSAVDYLNCIDKSLSTIDIPFTTIVTKSIVVNDKKVSYTCITSDDTYIYAHDNLGITAIYKGDILIASVYTVDQHKTELARELKPHKLTYYNIAVFNNVLYGATYYGIYKTHLDLTTSEQKSTEIEFGYYLHAINGNSEVSANSTSIYINHNGCIIQITNQSVVKMDTFKYTHLNTKMLVTNDNLYLLVGTNIYVYHSLVLIKQFEIREKNPAKLLYYNNNLIIVDADGTCAIYSNYRLIHRRDYDSRRYNRRSDHIIDASIINDKLLLLYATGRTRMRRIDV